MRLCLRLPEDWADAVDALPLVSDVHKEFNEDVVEVNRGLAVAYHALDREGRAAAVATGKDASRIRPAAWEERWSPAAFKEKF